MERPLSPFMFPTWYRFQLTSAMSILHRLTGIALAVGSILLAWWLVAVAAGDTLFKTTHAFLASPIGVLLLQGGQPQLALLTACFLGGAVVNGMQSYLYAVSAHSYPTEIRGAAIGVAQAFSRFGGLLSATVPQVYFKMSPVPPIDGFFWFAAIVRIDRLDLLAVNTARRILFLDHEADRVLLAAAHRGGVTRKRAEHADLDSFGGGRLNGSRDHEGYGDRAAGI